MSNGAAHRVSKYIRRTMGFYPTSGEKESPTEWATFSRCVAETTQDLREARIVGSNVRNKLDELRILTQTRADELWREVCADREASMPINTFLVNKSACETYAMTVALAVMGSFEAFVGEQREQRKRPRAACSTSQEHGPCASE